MIPIGMLTKRRFPRPAILGLVIGLGGMAACESAVSQDDQALDPLREELVVGVLDGVPGEVFGRVQDVRAMPDGSFLVLDQQSARIGWFNLGGDYLGGIDSQGQGPGELAEPGTFDLSSTGTLIVSDPGNGRLSIYDMTTDEIQPVTSVPVMPMLPSRNVCTMGDRIFIRRLHEEFLLHELDRDGEIVRSFQPVDPLPVEEYGPPGGFAQVMNYDGHVHCMHDRDAIVTSDRNGASVASYSAEGELLWATELPSLRPVQGMPLPQGGGIQYDIDPEAGAHMGLGVLRWDDESLLVQHGLWWPERADDADRERGYLAVESHQLSLDGEVLARTGELPLISDVSGRWVYSFDNVPYPRVTVLARED